MSKNAKTAGAEQVQPQSPRAELAKKPTTVKMVRSEKDAQGGPTEADVDPAMVPNYITSLWRVVK